MRVGLYRDQLRKSRRWLVSALRMVVNRSIDALAGLKPEDFGLCRPFTRRHCRGFPLRGAVPSRRMV